MQIRKMFFVVALMFCVKSSAQCTAENTAFEAGEILDYELYFNWKFVWMKAGKARLSTTAAKWEGRDVYDSRLVTSTSGKVDKHFIMRDTLQGIITKDLVPLYYKKAANEGGKYYVDQVWYTYENGQTNMRQEYLNRRGEKSSTTNSSIDCVYDMLTMMLRARSFDADDFKVGKKMIYPLADGRKVENITLRYRGKKNFKMRGEGTTYRCLIFSLVEYESKKEKEIITFYITDDENHMPVRLDLFLKFGTAKAYLNKAVGLRNECTSIVK